MLKSQGMSNRAIAHRLGISENAIRKLVGPSKRESAQLALAAITPAVEKPATNAAPSVTPRAKMEIDNELTITLDPLSSPHRTNAAQALCDVIDKAATIFPSSRLRMRFKMCPPRRIGLAFPGSPVQRSAALDFAPAP